MSEETLANGKQMVTLVGKIAMALSPVEVQKKVAVFWIDHPDALAPRVEQFAKLPAIVQVIGARLGPCRGLATLIDSWWGAAFDVYAIDTILGTDRDSFKLDTCADVVIVDSIALYQRVLDARDRLVQGHELTVVFVNTDKGAIPITPENVEVLQADA